MQKNYIMLQKTCVNVTNNVDKTVRVMDKRKDKQKEFMIKFMGSSLQSKASMKDSPLYKTTKDGDAHAQPSI